jgi:putative spermidine/putrescine transport system ATP-binding protein
VTILYVTHDQEEALSLSDRVALFNHGRIEQVGKGRDLYDRPHTRFVAGFVGHSNFLDCTIAVRRDARADIVFPDGSGCADIPLHAAASSGATARLMIRPDRLQLADPAHGAALSGIDAVLSDATFIGETFHFAVTTGWGAQVNVRLPAGAPMAHDPVIGERVRLSWEVADARLFAD